MIWGGGVSCWTIQHHDGLLSHSICTIFFSVPTKVLCAPHCGWCCPIPPHSFKYIMHYIASTSTNGRRLYYTLSIHSWFSLISYIQTVSYSIIYWYEQSNIMLAFHPIPCWGWSMIWWGGQSRKGDQGRGVRGPHPFCAVLKYAVLPTSNHTSASTRYGMEG